MAELVKPWNDGGSLTVAYEGDGDGSAVFSSDAYDGIDREIIVTFKGGDIETERIVRQEGIRQPIELANGGIFRLADGGRFGVLRELKAYTEIEYIESSGTQFLNLDVVFQNTDECYLDASLITHGSDKFIVAPSTWNNNNNRLGIGGGYGGTFGYAYGAKSTNGSTFNYAKDTNRHNFYYKNKTFGIEDLNLSYDVSTVTWGGDTSKLRLFYGYGSATSCKVYSYKQYRAGELIIDLVPVLDRDGVACMYDKVSGEYLYNKGTGIFIAGNKR